MIYLPPPDLQSRIQIIKIHTKKMPLDKEVSVEKLAEITDGFTGADIASIVSSAVMLAMREHVAKYSDAKEAEKHAPELKVTMRHIQEAMKKIKPLSPQELDWYKRVAEMFGKPRLSTEPAKGGVL